MEKIEYENKLLDAIKKDDLKSFSLLMPTNADLNLCYGRFPILSLLYLYSSFKILSKFEKVLMPIHNFRVIEERTEIYKSFKICAKKTIRLFKDNEIIYPVLMLGVLNERIMLKHNFKFIYKNAEIVDKLKKIYKIRYNSNVEIEADFVVIPTKRVKIKQTLLFSFVSVICCLFIALSSVVMIFVRNTTGVGTDKNPIRITTKQEFLSALKFGKRTYSLEKDIEINGDEFVNKNFSGKILGNGYSLSINGEIKTSLIKNMSGELKNLKIKLLENNVKITQNWAVIAENSSGKIENINISGSFIGNYNSTEEVFAGLVVSKNSGSLKNIDIKVSSTLTNSNQSNAYFGNIAGVNDGTISNCVVSQGIISADTVDLAGIVCENNSQVIECENNSTLIQTSDKQWHPNIAGVSILNKGTIVNCKNHAELNATSLTEDDAENKYYVFVGGIACENYGEIKGSRNFGSIFAKGKTATVIAGGLVSQNVANQDLGLSGNVETSLSKSNLDVKSEAGSVCVGGVVGLNATRVVGSGFIGVIDVDSNSTDDKDVFFSNLDKEVAVIAGGVVGVSQYSEIKDCFADVGYLSNGNAIVLPDENAPKKLFSGVVGNVGVFLYAEQHPLLPTGPYSTNCLELIKNNFYVEKEEIKLETYGVYAATLNWVYQMGQFIVIDESVLGQNNTAFNKRASLQDIPLEVIYE